MEKNQKIAVGIIVLIALIAAWQLGKQPQTQNENQNTNTQMSQGDIEETEAGNEEMTDTSDVKTTENMVWEGVLLESDNVNKGNYRLQTKDHMLYLRTSRDFNSMLGKRVQVLYEGTLESFVIGDIDVVQK